MIIQIDEKTRIHGTSMRWQLERPINRKEIGPVWEPYKYFATFGLALEAAGEAEIRSHPALTQVDAIEAVSAIRRKYGDCRFLRVEAAGRSLQRDRRMGRGCQTEGRQPDEL